MPRQLQDIFCILLPSFFLGLVNILEQYKINSIVPSDCFCINRQTSHVSHAMVIRVG